MQYATCELLITWEPRECIIWIVRFVAFKIVVGDIWEVVGKIIIWITTWTLHFISFHNFNKDQAIYERHKIVILKAHCIKMARMITSSFWYHIFYELIIFHMCVYICISLKCLNNVDDIHVELHGANAY